MNPMVNGAGVLANHIDGLPVHEAARNAARAELDRAERAVEWTVRVMDRLETLVEGMRGSTAADQANSRLS